MSPVVCQDECSWDPGCYVELIFCSRLRDSNTMDKANPCRLLSKLEPANAIRVCTVCRSTSCLMKYSVSLETVLQLILELAFTSPLKSFR